MKSSSKTEDRTLTELKKFSQGKETIIKEIDEATEIAKVKHAILIIDDIIEPIVVGSVHIH